MATALRPRAAGRRALRLIRLAVRCTPEQADLVLAELTVLAPNGVEEERGPGYVEYAIYGGEGELPELGDIDAAIGGGRVEVSATEIPDDWADRWRDFHKPLLVAERLWLRPSWEPPREGAIDLVVDPGQAFGTGAHPTTRLCLEFLWSWRRGRGRRPPDRPRHRLRRPGDRGGKARLVPDPGLRPRARRDRSRNSQRRSQRCRPLPRAHEPARTLPELAPTVVANMTAPILCAPWLELSSEQRGSRPRPGRLLRFPAWRGRRGGCRVRVPGPAVRKTAARTATGRRCCCVGTER